jgi:hypothetical protein
MAVATMGNFKITEFTVKVLIIQYRSLYLDEQSQIRRRLVEQQHAWMGANYLD